MEETVEKLHQLSKSLLWEVYFCTLFEEYINIDDKALRSGVMTDEDIVKKLQKGQIIEILIDNELDTDPNLYKKSNGSLKLCNNC